MGCSSSTRFTDTNYNLVPAQKYGQKKKAGHSAKVKSGDKIFVEKGITIKGRNDISEKAFVRARYVVNQMLTNLDYVRNRMAEVKYTVVIIASSQLLTDSPDYNYFKGETFHQRIAGARSADTVGGLAEDFICAVNEKSLIVGFLVGDTMVHEFAHAIHFHLYREDAELIRKSYNNAVNKRLYPMSNYIMENSWEYFAVASQVWFEVGVNSHSSGGLTTRKQLMDRDPELAELMSTIYGSAKVSMF